MGGEDGVVGLDHGRRHLGRRVDAELEFALLAVVDGESLHEQGGEAGAGAPSEGMEDEEALSRRLEPMGRPTWRPWQASTSRRTLSMQTSMISLPTV